MTLKTPHLAAALLALVVALGLAACGTSDDPVAEVPNPPNPPATTPTGGGGGGGGDDADSGDDDGGDDDSDGGGGGGGSGGGGDGGGGGGDDDGGDDSEGVDEAPKITGPKITRRVAVVSGEEPRFEPSGLLSPPGVITLIMRNNSDQEHGIAIAGDNVKKESEEVGPGKEARVTVPLPAGEYEFYCPVDDHRIEGMSGILTVGKLPSGVR
jgi:plastocyanin